MAGGIASANYSYTYDWSNSTGSSQTGVQSGTFTFSPTTFLYVDGTDDQQGYVNPTVWFYIDNNASVGSVLYLLNTECNVTTRSATVANAPWWQVAQSAAKKRCALENEPGFHDSPTSVGSAGFFVFLCQTPDIPPLKTTIGTARQMTATTRNPVQA